jgi:hypothetical protein
VKGVGRLSPHKGGTGAPARAGGGMGHRAERAVGGVGRGSGLRPLPPPWPGPDWPWPGTMSPPGQVDNS